MWLSLVLSSLVCLVSNSWLIIWVALEINTLSFTTLMLLPGTKKNTIESPLKYFIIQSIASAILVTAISIQNLSRAQKTLLIGGGLAILTKLARAPFHSWFIDLTNKTNPKNATLLMTWQKLAPLYLSIFISKSLVTAGIIIRLLTGSLSQMNKQKIMEYIALSSVFNLRWMLIATISRIKASLTFVSIYWTSVVLTIWMIKTSRIKDNIKEIKKAPSWLPIMVSSNLAGLPPSIGFLAKWILICQLVRIKATLIVTTLLVTRTINFFIYIRMFLTNLSLRPNQSPNLIQPQMKAILTLTTLTFIPTTIIIILYRGFLETRPTLM
jgi:NADH-quinone oxidoreductase subunit N